MILALVASVALFACSHSLSGTYVPQGGGVGNGLAMEKIEFLSGTEVNLTMMGQTIRADYKIDGEQVLFIVNGQQQVFNIDDSGCLDGGAVWGKFCKS
jgi:hypothetical protein